MCPPWAVSYIPLILNVQRGMFWGGLPGVPPASSQTPLERRVVVTEQGEGAPTSPRLVPRLRSNRGGAGRPPPRRARGAAESAGKGVPSGIKKWWSTVGTNYKPGFGF